jgi:hypothetical protein
VAAACSLLRARTTYRPARLVASAMIRVCVLGSGADRLLQAVIYGTCTGAGSRPAPGQDGADCDANEPRDSLS